MTAKKETSILEYDLAQILRIPAKKVIKCLVKALGQKVKKGELIACQKGVFKKRSFFAPVEGILDSLTEKGILRLKLLAKKEIKTNSSPSGEMEEIKGSWGKGDQIFGELFCLEKEATVFNLKGKHQNQILALRGDFRRGLWHKAQSIGIKGIICGGLPDEKFAEEIKKEVLLVGNKKKSLALPVVVLGNDGKISQDVWQILEKNQGKKIFIEGDNCRVLIPK